MNKLKSDFQAFFSLPQSLFTEAERKVLTFIKKNQPCSIEHIYDCGVQKKSLKLILDRIKWIKRGVVRCSQTQSQSTFYWLDNQFRPKRLAVSGRSIQEPLTNMTPLDSELLTKTQREVIDIVRLKQPCKLKDVIESGVNPKTASNILSKIRNIKRAPDPNSHARCFIYWIDDEFEPKAALKAAELKKSKELPIQKTVKQHPLVVALYGLKRDQCTLNYR